MEVAIGYSFRYLVVSRVNETVASLLRWRAGGLELEPGRLLTGRDGQPRPNAASLLTATRAETC